MQSLGNCESTDKKYCSSSSSSDSSKLNENSLHDRVAKFVLDIQSDVALEELLGAADQNNNKKQGQQRTFSGDIRLNDQQRRALKQLYNEIQEQQQGVINAHVVSAKRTSSDNINCYNRRPKLPRNMDCLLQGTVDNVDETWLLNLAEELGLDKDTDLPELNSDFVTELT